MLRNLKLIFLHGVNDTVTNYSSGLYQRIIDVCRRQLVLEGRPGAAIEQTLRSIVHHEVLWADLTTDRTNRYLQLAYPRPRLFWDRFLQRVDPLAIQIMHYIKDKGDKQTGSMDILQRVDDDMHRIFAEADVGRESTSADGHHAIVIAHSLGSVIAYDYLMGFRPQYRLDPSITIKSFITLGSPISLFTSAMGHPDSDLTLPPNVHRWVNIRSPRDGVGRPIAPFFAHIPIQEREVTTGFFPISAHNHYWRNAQTAAIIADEVLAAVGPK